LITGINPTSTLASDLVHREEPSRPNMVWIPGGTYRMGSDRHYPEEAPVHRVTVGGFWIDRTPVTNHATSASSSTPPAM
jgi:formylglycine-generating enzyme